MISDSPILIPCFVLKNPRKTETEVFSVCEFFIFKLKESHAPENVPETICCMYAPRHGDVKVPSVGHCGWRNQNTWCFSVVWRKNLEKVSGTRRKKLPVAVWQVCAEPRGIFVGIHILCQAFESLYKKS